MILMRLFLLNFFVTKKINSMIRLILILIVAKLFGGFKDVGDAWKLSTKKYTKPNNIQLNSDEIETSL